MARRFLRVLSVATPYSGHLTGTQELDPWPSGVLNREEAVRIPDQPTGIGVGGPTTEAGGPTGTGAGAGDE